MANSAKFRVGQTVKVNDNSPFRSRECIDVVKIYAYHPELNHCYFCNYLDNTERKIYLMETEVDKYTWIDAMKKLFDGLKREIKWKSDIKNLNI